MEGRSVDAPDVREKEMKRKTEEVEKEREAVSAKTRGQ